MEKFDEQLRHNPYVRWNAHGNVRGNVRGNACVNVRGNGINFSGNCKSFGIMFRDKLPFEHCGVTKGRTFSRATRLRSGS